MASQHLNGIWEITSQYGICIVLIFLVAWLIFALLRIRTLSNKLRWLNRQGIIRRAQLQDTYEKHDALVQQLQMLQAEANHLEQTTATVTDDTTALPDYHTLMNQIDVELSHCAHTQSSCAVLFLHLPSFKHINTTEEHDTGEAILRESFSHLQQNIRVEDCIGHYGKENFVLLLVETDLAGAIQTAERLHLEITSHPFFRSTEETTSLPIPASIGIAVYGLHGNMREALIQRAASAMYRARKDRDNPIRVADIDEAESTSLIEQEDNDEQSTINALTAAASAHHVETDKHARRMVMLAEETAREIGCSEQEIRLVRLSALLHDIGKIGIPEAILDKSGPLTEEEWEIMRQHPQIGQQILRQAGGVFATLAHVIVAHHERWDGKGYPVGLSEHNIPIEARILAVVDSFDAITSRRVYRQPASIEQARIELLRCAGSQFDPEVVIAFLHVLSRSIQTSKAVSQQDTGKTSIPVI
ncbi:MAG: diguanylate cyclase [Ktedonobacteraceae bacterium]|nr:diguanylate cyclase [Ktedonobacteraceae bacterium]